MLEKMFKDGVAGELSISVPNPTAQPLTSPTLSAVLPPSSAPSPCALKPIPDEASPAAEPEDQPAGAQPASLHPAGTHPAGAEGAEGDGEGEADREQAETIASYQTELAVLCAAAGERLEDVEAMCYFKLQMCPNKTPHDWTQCQYAHDGEVARRRNPSCHSANPCAEYEKSGNCHRGQRCPFAHGVWERGLHPQRYRTSLCSKGERCNRKICFFAHKPEQVRKPVKPISSFQHAAFLNFCKISKASAAGGAQSAPEVAAAAAAAAGATAAPKGSKKKKRQQDNSAAKANLNPSCASFTPVIASKEGSKDGSEQANEAEQQAPRPSGAVSVKPVTQMVAPQTESVLEESDTSVSRPASASAADERSQTRIEPVEPKSSAEPTPRPAYARQNSLEHNMAWAAWVRSPQTVEPPVPFTAPLRVYLSSNGAISVGGERVELGTADQEPEQSEKDASALESFSTSWVDNLLSDEAISKRIEVKPLSATSNNLQWIRWVLNSSRDNDGSSKGRKEFVPGAVIQVNEDTQGKGPVEGCSDFEIPPRVDIPSNTDAPGIRDLLDAEADSAPVHLSTPLSPNTQPPSGPGAMYGQDARAVRKPVGVGAEGGSPAATAAAMVPEPKPDPAANEMPPALFLGIHPSLLAKGVEVNQTEGSDQ
mmetsp:Transcript_3595/g.5708  ORF Transcript_3595/g.5708 Transcript_3595/m.5708 type:complete len:652 (+) Transcript_3595:306-2261(+)